MNDTIASLATLVIAGIGLVILLLFISTAAPASAICLTKQEARAIWPKQHIYWYSSNRCWSNRRGPPDRLAIDPSGNRAQEVMPKRSRSSEENEKPMPRPKPGGAVKIVRWDEFNEIDAQADNQQYFREDSIALWPPFLETWNYWGRPSWR